jgi:hypothetical protein
MNAIRPMLLAKSISLIPPVIVPDPDADLFDIRITHIEAGDPDMETCQDCMSLIADSFPELHERIPYNTTLLDLGFGVFYGVCTHPNPAKNWFYSNNNDEFPIAADVPDGFFAAGIQDRGSSEWLVVAWQTAGRRFWFRDLYVYYNSDCDASVERTRRKLHDALQRWDAGQ